MKPFASEMLNEARTYFIESNYKMAEPILQQLILDNAKNPEVFHMLATICYDRGQFNKAIKLFKRALEIQPTYTDASVGLSIILNDLGRYEEGREIFEKAQELLNSSTDGQDPYINEKLANKHEELADLYCQYARPKEALDQLLKAFQLSTRKAEITMRLADVYVMLGKVDRAIKDLRLLIREYPNFIPARLKLGTIYYQNSNIAEATEQWENILAREPNHSEAKKMLEISQAAGITSLEY